MSRPWALPLLLLFLPAVLQAAERPSAAPSGGALQAALLAAEQALALQETQLAESHYRDALFEGWLLLAAIERQRDDLPAARAAFEQAITAAVKTRRARIPLALVLAQMGATDEAEIVLRSLIAEDARDAEARRLLAMTLAEAGRLEEAVQELEQLRFTTPGDSENLYLLATAYLQQGRIEAADELLAEIATLLPTPQTHILIGRTYRDAELYGRAQRAFESALEMDPQVRRAHYYLGSVHLLGEGVLALADAARQFEQELLLDPENEITNLYLGMARVEERRFADAISPLEIASRRPDLRPDALRFLGRALLETGRTDEALVALRRGLEAAGEAPADPGGLTEFRARQISSLHYQLAQALRRAGDRDAAGFHFDQAKRYQARSAESARESLNRYLTSETTAAKTLDMATAEALPDSGSSDEAERRVRERAIEASVARAYFNLGVLQLQAGEMARAAGLFEQAGELEPQMPELQYSLGVARFNAGQFAAATRPLVRALESRPGDEKLEQMLALAWLNSEQYGEAAAVLAELEERRSNPGLQYAYGLALVRSGRASEAEEIFLQLLQDNAEWPELNVMLGQAFAQQGDFERATATLRQALALDPTVAEAHATLGEIHLRRGELEKAEVELRAELRHHPDDDRSRFTLATTLDLAQKPEEAKALLRTLLQNQPDLAKARHLLGKILLAQGAAPAALEQLEAAAGLAPDDANIRYQLGQAYQKLGRREDARAQFETYRALKRGGAAGAAGEDR